MDSEISECSYCKTQGEIINSMKNSDNKTNTIFEFEMYTLVCKEIRKLLKELEITSNKDRIDTINSRIDWLKVALPGINKHFPTEI